MLVGIGGASRSGKSSLAQELKKRNSDLSIIIISQDDYVFPQHEIPKIKNETDWECPESINLDSFRRAIDNAKENYDVIIAEGLLVFYFEELLSLFDKRIFVDIDKSTFLKRKDDDTRWGKIPEWYKQHIWESYLKYGLLDKNAPNSLFINGNSTINIKDVQHFLDLTNFRDYKPLL